MDDESVLSRDNLLAEDSHVNLVQADTNLFGGQESSLIKFARPNLLDCLPRLWEAGLRDPKLDQAAFYLCKLGIGVDELQLHHQVLALIEHLIHPLVVLGLRELLNKLI